MDGYNDDFYNSQYYLPPSANNHLDQSRPADDQHGQMMPYTAPDHMQVGGFSYPPQRPDMLASNPPFMFQPQPSNLPLQSTGYQDGRVPNMMFAYDPLSMSMGSGNPFAYDPSPYPSTMPLDHSRTHGQPLDHHSAAQYESLQSHSMNMDHTAQYAAMQTQTTYPSAYWAQSQPQVQQQPVQPQLQMQPQVQHPPTPEIPRTQPVSAVPISAANAPLPVDPANSRRRPRALQSSAPAPAPSAPASHRFIQPKRPSPVKASSSTSHPRSVSRGESSQYASIYSTSGFDIMGVLAEVVSRPNPKIDIGAVDLSCAFVLCDITKEDHPIVYVSEAFERLTGYTEKEIVGQNCRFLQGPDGVVQQGMKRAFVDQHTAFRLRSTIEDRTEIQASIINYRKGGQPFMNLITMIPIRWNSSDYRFYVGFQVDLVEKPDAVTRRNPNGTYMINYQRTQLPNYVVPASEIFRTNPELGVMFGPEEVSTVLDGVQTGDPNLMMYLERVLVENTDDVIHVLSFESEFLYLSASCRKILEYEPSELVGKTLSTVCHPSDIGPVVRDMRACTTTEPISMVYRIRRKQGGYVWFECHGSWHIADRRRQFMVLTGRVRPIYCLDQVAKLGRGGLAENDIWAKLSNSGIILFMSSRARAVLGRTPDTLIGKSLQDLIDVRGEAQRALGLSRNGQQTTFAHKIRHRKGHMLPVHTTLYPGDTKEGMRPSFLVAQISFPRPPASASPGPSNRLAPGQSTREGPSRLPSGNQRDPSSQETLFTELIPTRGSSWQLELRDLEKQNRSLSEELQRLLTRRKKRKRKLSTVLAEKSCATCHTKRTPEWRRGPSGNRDLCNSCGLRWAKQVRNAAQTQAQAQALAQAQQAQSAERARAS
ncbi:hypothetical protein P170DRAFT_351251 [Aspergillus steynii IBT 23096]|uniref:GATA transcription factor LreA n=1 Tax=Aspergillus steynii IBT 23096 TaxID=1392250 RepID=A0A2I2GFR2_9EURO|nr:uncharacterized protein P170DRAFT_351251 [Aspergillus steynii IBT 23096]PLB51722.1 hypothetical protein P170DRAFT_351251 [Aspergillus steynii IBT 23096]